MTRGRETGSAAEPGECSVRFRLAIGVAVVAVWLAGLGLLTWAHFDRAPWSARPFHSDEYKNWSAVRSFEHVGLQSGQYSVAEVDSRTDLSRFGPHGPVYPVLYGTLARVLGWPGSGAFRFNVLVLLAGVLGFFWMAPLTRRATLLSALVLVSTSLVVITLPLTLQESLQQTFGLLLAGLYLRYRNEVSWPRLMVLAPALGLLWLAVATRPTWAGAVVALVCFGAPRSSGLVARGTVAAVIVGAGLAFFLTMEPLIASSPLVGTASAAQSDGLVSAIAESVETSWRRATGFARDREPLYSASQRLLLVALLGALAVAAARRARWRPHAREAVFHVANLLFPLAASLAIANFGNGRDLRVFAPHILLSALVFAAGRARPLAWLAIALNVLWLVDFDRHFVAALEGPYSDLDRRTLTLREELPRLLDHRRGEKWCNTVLAVVDGRELRSVFLAVPPGIGVSVYSPRRLPLPRPRSAWVVTSDADSAAELPFADSLVAVAPCGELCLYENRGAACRAPASTR